MGLQPPGPSTDRLWSPVRFPADERTGGTGLGAFAYKLEREDGTPADPPALRTTVSNWQPGDTIPLGRDRTLRVIDTGRPALTTIRALIALVVSLARVAGVVVLLTRTTTGTTIADGTVEQADLSSRVQAQLTARRWPRGAPGPRGARGECGATRQGWGRWAHPASRERAVPTTLTNLRSRLPGRRGRKPPGGRLRLHALSPIWTTTSSPNAGSGRT